MIPTELRRAIEEHLDDEGFDVMSSSAETALLRRIDRSLRLMLELEMANEKGVIG